MSESSSPPPTLDLLLEEALADARKVVDLLGQAFEALAAADSKGPAT